MLSWIAKKRRQRYVDALKRRGLTLGKNVFLNDGFFLDPAHCYLIAIEDGVTFGPSVTVLAHDASTKLYLGKTKVGRVVIGTGAFVGTRSVILPGVTIGAHSIVGACSLVNCDVPAGELWAGNPARKIMNIEDLRIKHSTQPMPEFKFPWRMDNSQRLKRIEELCQFISTNRVALLDEAE